MELIIRRLTPSDADVYVALRRAMLSEAPLAFLASPEDDLAGDAESLRKRLHSGESVIFGAWRGALVGAVGVFRPAARKASHQARLWGMYVLPEQRRTGAGRQLVRAAIEHAQTLAGVSQLNLGVSETAGAARRLYESLGFRVWGTEPNALCHLGRAVSEHHMILELGSPGS